MEEIKGQQTSEGKGAGKKKNPIFLIIAILCLIVAIGAVVYLIRYYSTLNQQDDMYESLQAEMTEISEASSTESSVEEMQQTVTTEAMRTEEAEGGEEPTELNEADIRVIDFKALTTETNEDIYAWISIPDTNIDYPMVQHPTDDSYYLNYNLDGTKGYPGCIYTERRNAKDFSDFNTIIYGHNMKNGSMFHDLHSYEDVGFLEEHPYVYIYMPDRTLKYQIFAAYQYDDRHLLYSFDYASEIGRAQYLEEIFNIRSMSAVLDESVELSAESNIITMSTCVGGQATQRFLVQAVLLDDINES